MGECGCAPPFFLGKLDAVADGVDFFRRVLEQMRSRLRNRFRPEYSHRKVVSVKKPEFSDVDEEAKFF